MDCNYKLLLDGNKKFQFTTNKRICLVSSICIRSAKNYFRTKHKHEKILNISLW